jgi:hypothetical protein
MMTNVIVWGTVAFAAVLVAAWWLRPDLRVWMEQPKHRFQDDLRRYDESHVVSAFRRTNAVSGFPGLSAVEDSRTQGTSDTDRHE